MIRRGLRRTPCFSTTNSCACNAIKKSNLYLFKSFSSYSNIILVHALSSSSTSAQFPVLCSTPYHGQDTRIFELRRETRCKISAQGSNEIVVGSYYRRPLRNYQGTTWRRRGPLASKPIGGICRCVLAFTAPKQMPVLVKTDGRGGLAPDFLFWRFVGALKAALTA